MGKKLVGIVTSDGMMTPEQSILLRKCLEKTNEYEEGELIEDGTDLITIDKKNVKRITIEFKE